MDIILRDQILAYALCDLMNVYVYDKNTDF